MARARHIEVQILGDGNGNVAHLWERECTLQRGQQKLIEVAPSPSLHHSLRKELIGAALKMAQRTKYLGLGTFEFLVEDVAFQIKGSDPWDIVSSRPGNPGNPGNPGFYFMETNPRVQVEHTVTEALTGVDLIQTQLLLAQGHSLHNLVLPLGNVLSGSSNDDYGNRISLQHEQGRW